MALDFSYNKAQLETGAATAKAVSSNLTTLSTTIEGKLEDAITAGANYRVDLYESMDMSNLGAAFESFNTQLGKVCALAQEQGQAAQMYSDGKCDDTTYAQLLEYTNNKVYPDTATRVLATIGMGVAKFAEGFLSFFENIGDCFLSIGAGICSLFGADDTAKKIKDFAARDLSTELIENNPVFEWINETSYFDKDSAFANIAKFAGKATAAALTSSAICKVGTKLMSSAETAEKASKIAGKVTDLTGDAGEKLAEEMGKGKSIGTAFLATATTLLVDETLGKVIDVGITNPVTTKITGAVTDTAVEKGYKKLKDKATDVFGDKLTKKAEEAAVDAAKNTSTDTIKGAIEDQIPLDQIGASEVATIPPEQRKIDIQYGEEKEA